MANQSKKAKSKKLYIGKYSVGKILVGVLLVAVFAFFSISTVNKNADISRLQKEKAEVSAKYEAQEEENKELQAVLDNEDKDEYIEKKKISNTNLHPIIPTRRKIYNTFITEGVERELTGNHLVVILQNQNSNMYSDKVTVVPIEGDWNKIKPSYQTKLTNKDLYSRKLDKDPSRIIFADIMTIDKSKLGRKIGILKDEKFKHK